MSYHSEANALFYLHEKIKGSFITRYESFGKYFIKLEEYDPMFGDSITLSKVSLKYNDRKIIFPIKNKKIVYEENND